MDIQINDIIEMKKPHPCGNNLFKITRVGMDFKLICTKCGHEIMISRTKCEKNIKRVIRP